MTRPSSKAAAFLLTVAAVASMVTPSAATTVVAPCVAESVRTSGGTDTFNLLVCGTTGVGYNVQRDGSKSVSWKIVTNLSTRTCSWPVNAGVSCNGTNRVLATAGTSAVITFTTGAGTGVALATWDAPT